MSKRATVQPAWLDSMLVKWGRTIPGARGWYSVCPMIQSGIPTTAKVYETWEPGPQDFEDLCGAIDGLDHKYHCVIWRAYKPWTAAEMELELAIYTYCDRTLYNWLQAAAKILEVEMQRLKEAA